MTLGDTLVLIALLMVVGLLGALLGGVFALYASKRDS